MDLLSEKNKRLRNEDEWVKILNKVLKALQAMPGDESGNRVFTLRELLEPLGLYHHSATISRHLSYMRVMVKGDKQPNGTYLWHIDMTKKRITASDLRNARERHTKRIYATQNIKPKTRAPKQPVKTPSNQPEVGTTAETVGLEAAADTNDGFPNIVTLASELQAKLDETVSKLQALHQEIKAKEESLAAMRALYAELELEYLPLSEAVRNATASLMKVS